MDASRIDSRMNLFRSASFFSADHGQDAHATFLAVAFLLISPVCAQDAGIAEAILPQGGQRGTTVEAVLIGSFLTEPQEVLFYQPGIKCSKFEVLTKDIPGIWSLNNDNVTQSVDPGKFLKLTLEIAKDAPLGEHQFRLRTRDVLSEMLTFWVSPFPIVMEEHPFADDEKSDAMTASKPPNPSR